MNEWELALFKKKYIYRGFFIGFLTMLLIGLFIISYMYVKYKNENIILIYQLDSIKSIQKEVNIKKNTDELIKNIPKEITFKEFANEFLKKSLNSKPYFLEHAYNRIQTVTIKGNNQIEGTNDPEFEYTKFKNSLSSYLNQKTTKITIGSNTIVVQDYADERPLGGIRLEFSKATNSWVLDGIIYQSILSW